MGLPDESSVPLTIVLTSIESLLRETRSDIRTISDRLHTKAESAQLSAMDNRVTTLERSSAADEAASNAVRSMAVSRKAIWLSIGMSVANWLVSILMVTLFNK